VPAGAHDALHPPNPLRYEQLFATVDPMHLEVDVIVQHPLDVRAERFLSSVQRSANRVLRFRGDGPRTVVTVEAHAMDRSGAVRAALQEVAHIYPLVEFEESGEPGPAAEEGIGGPAPVRQGLAART